ncbi:putative clathrin assembly protein At1g03050 [Cynara cardunculus var. scolymus]|uniref:putative clathrin assembly protein At1g03050 n=1 Tax=Cynara cardunculus var. scolymus TaxID=59895 RepID=UPI000D627C89|nr:putative clathrin assembly protein At1g03050 [Cynara cardunculus var. scolymus]
MGSSRFRKAIGRVKDQTTIGLARVSSSTSLPDLDVAIVKATRHDDYPAEDRHIQEILNLTSCSQAYVATCVTTISRRLNKTRNWVVALKALILIQRLLEDGDPAYEQEIFFATRRGTRLLNMSDFRDMSRSNTWDFSAFVRMYAFYLDEQLEYRMQRRRGKHSSYSHEEDEEEQPEEGAAVVESPIHKDYNQHLFSRLQHLMRLLERFLACRPSGPAKSARIVMVALYPLVKQSFHLYYDITEILRILIDQFTELEIPESIKVYEILRRVGKQYEELDYFYDWCKSVGLARTSEYPDVEKISQKKLKIMDEFIREKSVMGQFRIEGPEAEEEEEPDKPKPEPEPEPEPDMNAIKALPGPEGSEEKQKEDKEELEKTQDVGALLNLGDDAPNVEDHADKLALALFDGSPATTAPVETGIQVWKAYKGSEDWETALVETPSHLSNQQPSLPGGFNTLLLDGMYQQAAMQTAMANTGMMATGSASSVAFGSAGRPAPAPTSANGRGDPFSASLPLAPPPYVQMAEMEKKQRLLVEEQMMWQQHQRDALRGQVGLAKIQTNQHPYHVRGYTFPK